MAMTMESQRRPSHLDTVGFDAMSGYAAPRQFTDCWGTTSSATPSSSTTTVSHPSLFPFGLDALAKQSSGARSGHQHTNSNSSTMSLPYANIPVSTSSMSMPVSYAQSDLLTLPNHVLSAPRLPNQSSYGADLSYASSSQAPSAYYPPQQQAPLASAIPPRVSSAGDRRWSQPSIPSTTATNGFLTASMDGGAGGRPRQSSLIDLNRGMAPSGSSDGYVNGRSEGGGGTSNMMVLRDVLEDDTTTPRNIYDVQAARHQAAADVGYGFPAPSSHHGHSSSSSVSSSASPYPPSYYGSMGDSSLSDYSSTSESVDALSTHSSASSVRALSARPPGAASSTFAATGIPPGPQSMMGQFNSKISSSAQKKHRCKVCEKRFTRPSSLRTHMYSHTGEKPFCCDVDGCGRHFSVVSNLRRHRKVHRGERETSSPEEC